jgi:hypothetical protein
MEAVTEPMGLRLTGAGGHAAKKNDCGQRGASKIYLVRHRTSPSTDRGLATANAR